MKFTGPVPNSLELKSSRQNEESFPHGSPLVSSFSADVSVKTFFFFPNDTEEL